MARNFERSTSNPKRLLFIVLGLALFLVVYYMPSWKEAVDPVGRIFYLSPEGKGAIGLFLMASVWWMFEVVPIGVTGIAIGLIQALFFIRPAKDVFQDFMHPSVMFILASVVLGLALSKTGLTRRLAYNILEMVGEKTSRVVLGCLVVTALLAHFMAHTAAAAIVFPILFVICDVYGEGYGPSNFGKSLFIGMAYAAGAGSIVTMFGSARTPAAMGLFGEITGTHMTFFDLPWYLFIIGWGMVLLIWIYLMLFLKPEKNTLPGLQEKLNELYIQLGPMSPHEMMVGGCVVLVAVLMGMQYFVPAMADQDLASFMLLSTVLLFLFQVLSVQELEDIPWNIILLFSGAMSLGICLWKTGAAQWMGANCVMLFHHAPWVVFVLTAALIVLVLTNIIINIAAIAIALPVALVVAPYLGVAPDVVFYACLVTAGMPFCLLMGAAPNAIAYESEQFSRKEFFRHGVIMSAILMVVLALAVTVVWPLLGMPMLLK